MIDIGPESLQPTCPIDPGRRRSEHASLRHRTTADLGLDHCHGGSAPANRVPADLASSSPALNNPPDLEQPAMSVLGFDHQLQDQ
jgi:hypothetical protein